MAMERIGAAKRLGKRVGSCLVLALWLILGAGGLIHFQDAHASEVAANTAAANEAAAIAESAWAGGEGEPASVRLVSSVTGTGERETLELGLEFRMEPGWKIYWRSPGDAGFPPMPNWEKSENVADVIMDWPVPERFKFFDLSTVGYKDGVVFPLKVRPETPGNPVRLAGSVDYLICEEICIPGHAELDLALAAGPAEGSDHAHMIDRYRALVPVEVETVAGLQVGGGRLEHKGDLKAEMRVTIAGDAPLENPDILVEGPEGLWFSKPDVSYSNDRRSATLTLVGGGLPFEEVAGKPLRLTLLDNGRALDKTIQPNADESTDSTVVFGSGVPSDGSPGGGTGFGSGAGGGVAGSGGGERLPLFYILGLAVLGGLILNLMPCVLPVLSLKLLGVIRKSGSERREVRIGFLASAAGILASFMILASAAVAVKLAGHTVGWGIQFQQPIFLALMVALLTLFACNLLGLFEFRLPSVIGDNIGGGGPAGHGHFGDFLTGAFATLLATPCTAPFLGTAVGFALSRGAVEVFAVFAALGLGLALPYLAVALFPGLVRVLPKPGNWMTWLKRILALALAGTAAWLISVLAALVGIENALGVAALVVVAGAVLAVRKLEGSRIGRYAWPVSAMLAGAAVLAPLTFDEPRTLANDRGGAAEVIAWQTFDRARIPELVASGKTVFVDVTADWCVTCQWNKKAVLERGDVVGWLASDDVVAMQADWTRPDPVISAYLAEYGRYGIPFNIIYGPDAPEGITLPELLNGDAVMAAAKEAGSTGNLASRQ